MGKKSKRTRQREKRFQECKDYRVETTKVAGYDSLSQSEYHNELFSNYYQGQKIVPDGEWEQFISVLKTPLPVAFRVTGFKSQREHLMKIIKDNYFSQLPNTTVDGKPIEPPTCLTWYPDGLAWQLALSKKEVRSSAGLKKFHSFLVSETESGNTSRQETVSMIPPLLLDVKPHHKVLDMCAAPGSKTAQLIEYLHADESQAIPTGFVVANDVDNKRCYLMVHQIKRLQSPCCFVINHDAMTLPKLQVSQNDKSDIVWYDRVLADVPCSGDGTLRKNIDIWRKWNPAIATNLFGPQSRILSRGLELLAVGGRLVYSTCSFNPIENEAIIASILIKCKGTVELIDVSDKLPGLRTIPGLTTWRCMSKAGGWYEKYEDVPQELHSVIRPAMFPPSHDDLNGSCLQRCLRVLPHHQNTGGFFIAVLQKTATLPWMKTKERVVESTENMTKTDVIRNMSNASASLEKRDGDKIDAMEACSTDVQPVCSQLIEDKAPNITNLSQENVKEDEKHGLKDKTIEINGKRKLNPQWNPHRSGKKARMPGFREDPFLFLDKDSPLWPPIQKFYSIPDTFPHTQLMYRCETGMIRNLYFVAKAVKNLVECNDDKVKIINLGVKILGRSPSPLVPDCHFRMAQEGLGSLHHFFQQRKVELTKDDVITILSEECPFFSKLSVRVEAELLALVPGSTLFYYKPDESFTTIFCGWRGKTSVRSFVAKHEREHYLRLCGIELADIQQRVAEEKEAKKLAAEKAAQILDEESVAKDTETSSVNEQVLRTDNLVEDEALPMSEKFNKRENMDQHISEEDSCMESNTIHKDDVSLEEK